MRFVWWVRVRRHLVGGGVLEDAHHGGEGAAAQRALAPCDAARPQLLRADAAEAAARRDEHQGNDR